jgi:hypothetical protein
MTNRGAVRAVIVAYVALVVVAGCSTIVGVQDFSPSSDGGRADGTVVPDSDADGSGSSSGADSGGGADATDANTPDSGPGCVIGGTTYSSGTANPSNACQICEPSLSTSSWSDVTEGTQCGSGEICHAGACGSGCEIAGAYSMTNAVNPSNACQSCQPSTSTSAWSSVAAGTGCGNGKICGGGQCATPCDIGGTIYAINATNPGNGQRLPELPTRHEHRDVDERRERSELRRGRYLQRGELRFGLLHQRDGLRLGHGEPDEQLPELPTEHEHDGVDQRRERNELRFG